MKITKSVVAAVILLAGAAFAQGNDMHDHGAMMAHANPMPSLMRVVKQHGDQLNLSEEQSKALAQWREERGKPLHAKVDELHKLEQEMFDAAMAGKGKAELMNMAAHVMNERSDIISTKIDCRDNMKRILTPEQFSKVTALYQK